MERIDLSLLLRLGFSCSSDDSFDFSMSFLAFSSYYFCLRSNLSWRLRSYSASSSALRLYIAAVLVSPFFHSTRGDSSFGFGVILFCWRFWFYALFSLPRRVSRSFSCWVLGSMIFFGVSGPYPGVNHSGASIFGTTFFCLFSSKESIFSSVKS